MVRCIALTTDLVPINQKRDVILSQGTADIKEKLSRAFPKNKVKKREGPKGIMLDYITWADIAARMNEVFPAMWSMEIIDEKGIPLDGTKEEIVVKVKVSTPLGTQEAYGSGVFDKNNRNDKYSDALQKATHQAFKRAVAPWGPGLNLYSKDDEGENEDFDAMAKVALKSYAQYIAHPINVRTLREKIEKSSFPIYEVLWGMIINNIRDGTPLP